MPSSSRSSDARTLERKFICGVNLTSSPFSLRILAALFCAKVSCRFQKSSRFSWRRLSSSASESL